MIDIRSESAPLPPRRPNVAWLLWAVSSAAAAVGLATTAVDAQADRSFLLPGETSHGHYQIELQCGECHAENFDDGSALQNSCERCHAADLRAGDDSHPKSKFNDPRNAALLEKLDARRCAACHKEHDPEVQGAAGLTLPNDFCFRCHQDIGKERNTHRDLTFDTCANGGCHNFHDNKALYEDFLALHLNDSPSTSTGLRRLPPAQGSPPVAFVLEADQATEDQDVVQAWSQSAHAHHDVNCSGCHSSGNQTSEESQMQACKGCHKAQYEGWTSGRHGMRVAVGLPPMLVQDARLPMQDGASHRALTCNSCHVAHEYDTQEAATEACLGCHADEHSKNFVQSKHYASWQAERAGLAPVGSGVSCATCHMPRLETESGTRVEHNQNANLRPNEKMIRTVCTQCHGVPFVIDALADPALIDNNFVGLPARHVESTDFVRARLR